ncbi:YoaK family protein [Streptomyces sp. NPDC015684]|uniref:YoaK family protein n=1 Tax=Streptomyces sp. NPDC015684 TaxID=3364963 RepID=UPI0036FFDF38
MSDATPQTGGHPEQQQSPPADGATGPGPAAGSDGATGRGPGAQSGFAAGGADDAAGRGDSRGPQAGGAPGRAGAGDAGGGSRRGPGAQSGSAGGGADDDAGHGDSTGPRPGAAVGPGGVEEALPTDRSVRLGILLALVGGGLDAYTFISRGGVFANAQSGNVVLMGVAAAQRHWWDALGHLPAVVAFLAGVLVAETIRRPRVAAVLRRPACVAMVLECVVLAVVGLIPASAPDALVTVLIAFMASVQMSTFRTLVDTVYNSTMTTGNLRSAMQNAYEAVVGRSADARRRARHFAAVVLAFLAGAFGGGWLTFHWGTRAVWAACAVLAAGLALFVHDERMARKLPKAGSPGG